MNKLRNLQQVFLLSIFLLPVCLFAQKPVIDSNAFKWPLVQSPAISNNGDYVAFVVNNRVNGINTLVISDMNTGNRITYNNKYIGEFHFLPDNARAYFRTDDSLHVITLTGKERDTSFPISSCSAPIVDFDGWLAYQPTGMHGSLIVSNLINQTRRRFEFVKGYQWQDHGGALMLTLQKGDHTILDWVSIPSLTDTEIWSGKNSQNLQRVIFSPDRSGVAFMVKYQTAGFAGSSVWFSSDSGKAARLLADSCGTTFDLAGFNRDGKWLFLRVKPHLDTTKKLAAGAPMVDVYSYRDMVLESQQSRTPGRKNSYLVAVSVSGGCVVRLERDIDGESRIITDIANATDHIILQEKLHRDFEPDWLVYQSAGYNYYIVSLQDGSRKLLKGPSKFPCEGFNFSPDGKYVLYWDSQKCAFSSYAVATGLTTIISGNIPKLARKGDYVDMFEDSLFPQTFGQACWTDNGQSALIYDHYDIWKINLTGKIPSINLTANYGAAHHILLRLVREKDNANLPIIYKGNETVLLTGFDERTKQNGFFELHLDKPRSLKKLTMGDFDYFRTGAQLPAPRLSRAISEYPPVKADSSNAWILLRQTASDYPNLFYTRDWKNFVVLTDLHPQKDYNWMTSELVNYKQLDGTPSQGILYKPENFDPRKKYPVIFNYYEHYSYRLYEFLKPEYAANEINIPWFVSRGYLVFTEDNHYTVASSKNGKTVGEAVLNSVAGAAKYLSRLSFVDSKHIGIQGHSFGGGETNYLVTHSHLFAAACSAAGTVSDQVSAYLGPWRRKGAEPGYYRVEHSENGHEMIGATLWQRPDLYFRSSSIFNAYRVTTPLLLMHNETDTQTDWGQSFELYTALTRLGKPAWLLQYDGEGHSLGKEEDQKDYTIRMTQFFDHYLKDAPAPRWMVKGIPANLKGIEQGYELEPGKTP